MKYFKVNNIDTLINHDKNFFKIKFKGVELIKYRNKPLEFRNLNSESETQKVQDKLNVNNSYYISDLNGISDIKYRNLEKGKYYNLSSNMEKEILSGEINFKKTNQEIEIYYFNKDYDFKVPIDLFSSALNKTFLIVFYLKYILKKDDILIIEDPEVHMHPENQIKLIRYLIKAVNNELNIIIITHSDYILDTINNHILMSNIKEDKLKYSKEEILEKENIHIYHYILNNIFNASVKEIPIDSTGFTEDNFTKVSSKVYNECVKLMI